jgi:hypothetical protein
LAIGTTFIIMLVLPCPIVLWYWFVMVMGVMHKTLWIILNLIR